MCKGATVACGMDRMEAAQATVVVGQQKIRAGAGDGDESQPIVQESCQWLMVAESRRFKIPSEGQLAFVDCADFVRV
jgi:hypothetical protein